MRSGDDRKQQQKKGLSSALYTRNFIRKLVFLSILFINLFTISLMLAKQIHEDIYKLAVANKMN